MWVLIFEGPAPGAPWNVTVIDDPKAFTITVAWQPPLHEDVAVAYYRVDYKTETEQYKAFSKEPILPPQTSYTGT